jgi:hypothetical protein
MPSWLRRSWDRTHTPTDPSTLTLKGVGRDAWILCGAFEILIATAVCSITDVDVCGIEPK